MSQPVDRQSAFIALGLDPRLIDAIGYEKPSPIQREAIPHVIEGKDLIGLAGTGTGKTAAFALPIIHKLRNEPKKRNGISALILTPTRELAMQVAKSVKTYGKPFRVDVQAVFGGVSYSEQIRAIKSAVDVIVATPGRALDLIRRGKLPLESIQTVVIDEADEMLDMGFADDMDAILAETPKTRQTMLFSATMPPRIEELALRHLCQPVRIKVTPDNASGQQAANIRQTAYLVKREFKALALGRILELERPTSAIVFCRTRNEVEELVEVLSHRLLKAHAIHGGLTQEQRDRVMGRFRSGQADLLIATDIAARGLDIPQLSHVVNFDVPTQPESYVHRIGRVGRAGRSGVAITLVSPKERREIALIERLTKQSLSFASVPTAKDLRHAQNERLRSLLRTTIAEMKNPDELRGLLSELEKESSTTDIALAAMRLLQVPLKPDDEIDIPSVLTDRRTESRRPSRGFPEQERKRVGNRPTRAGMAKVFFGIGSDSGVMSRDLATAISREAGVPRNDLGVIDLTDRFALVEVPVDLAGYVIEAMQGVRIRGRNVNVRADRPPRQ